MGSIMAKPSRGRRPLSLEVGFEMGRGGRDVLGRAYERLLPLFARSLPPSTQATIAKGAHHESPLIPPSGDLQVASYARVSSDQQAERHTIEDYGKDSL